MMSPRPWATARRLAIEVVALSAIAVGACVSVCGAIAFVGLIAPFAARTLTRGHPGRALLPAAAVGALLLLLADLLVRLGSGWPCNSRGRRDDRNRNAPVHLDRRENAPDGGVMTPRSKPGHFARQIGSRRRTCSANPGWSQSSARTAPEDKPAPGACGYRARPRRGPGRMVTTS